MFSQMKNTIVKTLMILLILGMLVPLWQPAAAADGKVYPTYGPRTINLGKQGLFLSNPPQNTAFVEIAKIHPPLRQKYTVDVDISYRGPALDITFMNNRMVTVNPQATLSSVYFNVSEPEVKLWEEGGSEEIAIWYYNKKSEEWSLCYTRLINERANNEKYDRLACFIMGNGIYLLGKMEIDKTFPLLFKLQGEELNGPRHFTPK
jgi:hypothetical protein